MAGAGAADRQAMIALDQAFSPSYARARTRFLEAAATAGLPITSYEHPLKGRDGEVLAMDVAIAGDPQSEAMLIVSSACHGVEGYCGSGVQVAALHDQEWLEHARAAGVAVLYIHALNPYGFSYWRRATQENVDLNRNFNDDRQTLPANPAYDELHTLLLPEAWPPDAANIEAITQYVASHGVERFQAAVTQGQYTHADGLFFGGTAPTWSNRTVRQVLRHHANAARRLAWIDLHTGLGPSGLGERIFACKDDPVALERARQWWGGDGATPITSFYDGSSSSARLTGLMWNAAYEECPLAEYTAIAMEYGTLPIQDMILALRAEQWLHNHPDADADLAARILQQILDAFYVDTDAWRGQIIAQARQALFQGVSGLGSAVRPA
jgi:hypothetical protein